MKQADSQTDREVVCAMHDHAAAAAADNDDDDATRV